MVPISLVDHLTSLSNYGMRLPASTLDDVFFRFIHTYKGHVNSVYQVAWSPDSSSIASCSKDSTVKIWDVKKRRLVTNLPGHLDEVYCIDWSPTGNLAASAGKDKLVKMYA